MAAGGRAGGWPVQGWLLGRAAPLRVLLLLFVDFLTGFLLRPRCLGVNAQAAGRMLGLHRVVRAAWLRDRGKVFG